MTLGRVIYVSSEREISVSTPKSRPCFPCCDRTAFAALEKLRSISVLSTTEEGKLARKTVLVCDNCGNEIQEGKGATMRLNFTDARRGSKQADLCDNCAGNLPGQAVARRGRRPKSANAA
jgi:hypothetical protein